MTKITYAILPILAIVAFMPAMAETTDTENLKENLPNQDLFYEPGNPNRPVTMGELDAIHNDLTGQINNLNREILYKLDVENSKTRTEITKHHELSMNTFSNMFNAVFKQLGNIVHILIVGEAPPYTPPVTAAPPTAGSTHP